MAKPVEEIPPNGEKNGSFNESKTSVRAENTDTFADGGHEELYAPIEKYEGAHRYDPSFQWSEPEEKQLIRKLDYKICAWVCLMFFALQLDRGNIAQALSDNMLNDIGLTTNQYNYGQTIFYISFLCAELPSQMISKKLGPDVWIPIQMVSWSIVACCQSRITGQSSFYATRALMGLIEGGFIPDVVLYLSYFYKGKELPVRLAFFWSSYIMTNIVSAFLAFGILHMRGISGWAGWRWLFALEGGLTAIIGILSWFYLPPSPTQTASRFRGKDGWFSEQEEKIMVNRILRDDPSKGGMHNRQGLTPKLLWEAMKDFDLWPVYIYGLTWSIPTTPITAYLTLNLKSLGFDTFQTNLLTIPAYALYLIQLLFWTWYSEKINNRFLVVLITQLWVLPLVIALELLPTSASPWSWYALSALLIGNPYTHAILVAITSRNAGTVRTRTVGSAFYNMCVQASNIISSNIYRTDDAPYYRKGNKVLIAVVAWNIVYVFAMKGYYMWRNKQKETRWGVLTTQEKDEYLKTTTDQGSKRLDFRFAH
ncbi:major facilitator superfamily domain-containing protein [Truncatella angustata]|uniref:Major facilitator superfamily domain-containing protein n=1 Tax=Truncatella angustata TaxID=152316 RepID=A0A9P9A4F6_9PEZI|nr:major facilitator superfamily domain-containing protein [Truncatella angustata]KAH6660245.1 major facilitator superfamily domain-containing protein [Truncatella angustata]